VPRAVDPLNDEALPFLQLADEFAARRDELRKRMQALGWQLVDGHRSMKFEKI
jgi:hypothetical protein